VDARPGHSLGACGGATAGHARPARHIRTEHHATRCEGHLLFNQLVILPASQGRGAKHVYGRVSACSYRQLPAYFLLQMHYSCSAGICQKRSMKHKGDPAVPV
jgi:hypothetical protein